VAQAIRDIGVSDHTYYKWRAEYGGLNLDQVRKLKQLERDNARLKRAVRGPKAAGSWLLRKQVWKAKNEYSLPNRVNSYDYR
jgi:transposase-like protein